MIKDSCEFKRNEVQKLYLECEKIYRGQVVYAVENIYDGDFKSDILGYLYKVYENIEDSKIWYQAIEACENLISSYINENKEHKVGAQAIIVKFCQRMISKLNGEMK